MIDAQYLLASRPAPRCQVEAARWAHTALRQRMLDGAWERDLLEEIRLRVSAERARIFGKPDMSCNPFAQTANELGGVLYAKKPRIAAPTPASQFFVDPAGGPTTGGPIDRAGLWALMQDFAVHLLGYRENLIRVDSVRGALRYRTVAPHFVVALPSITDPSQPAMVRELQARQADGALMWVWEEVDIRDPAAPTHKILSADRQTDLTERFLGPQGGYQWRWTQGERRGEPYLPYVLYHAAKMSQLWDPRRSSEVVSATLTCGVLFTFWVHAVKSVSWVQRCTLGMAPRGAKTHAKGDTAGDRSKREHMRTVALDPSAIFQWDYDPGPAGEDGPIQPMQWQWAPSVDVADLYGAIAQYVAQVSGFFGVGASDIQRTAADPRSGVSLAITSEAKRSHQQLVVPQLTDGDLQVIAISAAMWNRDHPGIPPVAEAGYAIEYPPVALSEAEQLRRTQRQQLQLDQGVVSPVDVVMECHPGIDRDQAKDMLRRTRNERIEFGVI